MLQLDRVGVSPGGLALMESIPAFSPLPAAVRDTTPDLPRLGALGLALGAAVGAWLEYLLLRRAVGRRIGATRLGGGHLTRTVTAAGVSAAAGVGVRAVVAGLPPLAAGPLAAAVLGAVFLMVAWRLGVPEAGSVVAAVRGLRR